MTLSEKLAHEVPLRLLMISDFGFGYGAGIAMRRQAKSFLLRGDRVMSLAYCVEEPEHALANFSAPGTWLGIEQMFEYVPHRGAEPDRLVERFVARAAAFLPDVVIVGNLHSSPWAVSSLKELKRLKALIVGYMHDTHFVTGRCVYPGSCRRYVTGCNLECPTPTEYPPLAPSRIRAEWELRQAIFGIEEGIPLAANSRWLASIAREAIPSATVDVVPLALDSSYFRPGNDPRQDGASKSRRTGP